METRRSIITKSNSQKICIFESIVQATEEWKKLQLIHPWNNRSIIIDSTDFLSRFLIYSKSVFAVSECRIVVTNRHYNAIVVPTTVLEILPSITNSNVQVRIYGIKLLLIVQIEVKQSVLLQLPSESRNRSTITVIVFPCCRAVFRNSVMLFSTRPVITKVQVSMQFRKEVERIIKLQVTVRTENVCIIVAVVQDSNWVFSSVDIQLSTVSPNEIAVINTLARNWSVRSWIISINSLSRVSSDSSTNSATSVNELVTEIVTLCIQLNAQVTVKELRSQVNTSSQTVHAWALDNTIVTSVVHRNTIRKDTNSTTNAQVVVVRDCSAKNVLLPGRVIRVTAINTIWLMIWTSSRSSTYRAKSLNCIVFSTPIVCDNVSELICRKCFPSSSCLINIHVCREIHLRFSRLTFLSCNDDNTVRCTRTIDSSGRSIFQYSHWFNVVRADHSQWVWHTLNACIVDRHTVNND